MLTRILTATRGAALLALITTVLGLSTPGLASEVDLSLAKLGPAACPFQADARMSCGELSVPENWTLGANSRRITVPYLRVAAAHPRANRAPVAILTGGPGTSIVVALGMLLDSPLADAQDAIFIEPRGYGLASPALSCASIADLRACHERLQAQGIDLSRYGVEDAARDFEALRRALKIGPWDLYGVSYGGVYALTEVRLYPGGVRSMVLDSPAPPQITYDGNRVSALNAMGRMFDSCKADARCNAAYPDLRNRFIAGFRGLNAHPQSFNGASIGGGSAFQAFYNALYLTPSLTLAPKMADALARQDVTALMAASAEAGAATAANFGAPKGLDPRRTHALGLNAQVVCAEMRPFPAHPEMAEALNSPWPKDIIGDIRPEGWDYEGSPQGLCAKPRNGAQKANAPSLPRGWSILMFGVSYFVNCEPPQTRRRHPWRAEACSRLTNGAGCSNFRLMTERWRAITRCRPRT